MQDIPQIIARSLGDAERDLPKLDSDDAVVSIGAPETAAPDGFDHENPRHLRLQFEDVTDETPSFGQERARPPRRDHIRQLIEAADDLLDTKLVYCHCAAGISRSTAAAFILQCLCREPGDEKAAMEAVLEDNSYASPNRLMVQHADDLLERNGQMVRAVEEAARADTPAL